MFNTSLPSDPQARAIESARANPHDWPPGYLEYLERDAAAEDRKLRVRAIATILRPATESEIERWAALEAIDPDFFKDSNQAGAAPVEGECPK